MQLRTIIAFNLLFVTSITYAQDWKKQLAEDLVKLEDNKFKTVDYTLMSFSNGNSIQIKSYAEASADGSISRDNFIGFFAILTHEITNSIPKEGGYSEGEYHTKTIDELIGNPDVEINCYMNKNGIQIEVKTQEGVNRITKSWAEIMD